MSRLRSPEPPDLCPFGWSHPGKTGKATPRARHLELAQVVETPWDLADRVGVLVSIRYHFTRALTDALISETKFLPRCRLAPPVEAGDGAVRIRRREHLRVRNPATDDGFEAEGARVPHHALEVIAQAFVIGELADRAEAGRAQRACGVLWRHRRKSGKFDLLETPLANLLERAGEVCLQFVPQAVELEPQPAAGRVGERRASDVCRHVTGRDRGGANGRQERAAGDVHGGILLRTDSAGAVNLMR